MVLLGAGFATGASKDAVPDAEMLSLQVVVKGLP